MPLKLIAAGRISDAQKRSHSGPVQQRQNPFSRDIIDLPNSDMELARSGAMMDFRLLLKTKYYENSEQSDCRERIRACSRLDSSQKSI